MFTFGEKFRSSHQRQVGELELIRQSALRDYRELANSDKAVVLQNLSLHDAATGKHIPRNVFILNWLTFLAVFLQPMMSGIGMSSPTMAQNSLPMTSSSRLTLAF